MCDQYLRGLGGRAAAASGRCTSPHRHVDRQEGSMQRASEFLVLGLLLGPACSGGAADDPGGDRGSGGRRDTSATGGAHVDGSGGQAIGSGGMGASGSGGAAGGGAVGTGAS